MPNTIDYQHLWDTMVINDIPEVIDAAKLILQGKETYIETVEGTNVPWYFIGLTHYREGDCDFTTHPHNGDSLKARTKDEPSGRPVAGNPPFSWQESAKDCYFTLKKLDRFTSWSLPEILERLEAFNGFGYRDYHPDVLSPYLWSKTNHYTAGKYASDGKFNPQLVDKQSGCAPILRYLTDHTLGVV